MVAISCRRALGATLLFGAVIVAGCSKLPFRGDPPGLMPDPGGEIEVPMAVEGRKVMTLVTSRKTLPVKGELASAHLLFQSPGDSGWRDGGGRESTVVLPLPEEGLYHLALSEGAYAGAASVATGGMRVLVDRTPPRLQIEIEVQQQDLWLRWSVEEPLPLSEGPRLHYSPDAGSHWRAVGGTLDRKGEFRWPKPPPPLENHHFRLEAIDLAGNAAVTAVALGEPRQQPGRAEEKLEPLPPSEVKKPEVAATASRPLPDHEVWRELRERGSPVAGRTTLRISGPPESVILLHPDGLHADRSVTTLPLGVTGLITLPPVTGAGFRLQASIGGEKRVSPAFAIDSNPPHLEVQQVEVGAGSISLKWHAEDGEDPRAPVVTLHYRGEGKWQEKSLPASGAEEIPLEPGSYLFYLSARDATGNRTPMPRPEQFYQRAISGDGPRPLNFYGETYRGGMSHVLFLSRSSLDPSHPIEVVAVPVEGSTSLSIATVSAGERTLLWTLPAESGRYWLELRWQDAAGQAHSSRGVEPFTIDCDAPQIEWQPTREFVGEELELVLKEVGSPPEKVSQVIFQRRESTAQEWQAVPVEEIHFPASGSPENSFPEIGEVRVRLDTRNWEEGSWQVAAQVEDRLGNRSPEPIPGPRFTVD
ncbi:MAG: hypothetical protein V3T77_05635, partial [Planctomycetota bacterium]